MAKKSNVKEEVLRLDGLNKSELCRDFPTLVKFCCRNNFRYQPELIVKVKGDLIEVEERFSAYLTLNELIAKLQAFKDSLAEDDGGISIDTVSEYGDTSVQCSMLGYRTMTPDEKIEVDIVRRMCQDKEKEIAFTRRQNEIERARKVLKEAGEL